jgi:hypothetical protein
MVGLNVHAGAELFTTQKLKILKAIVVRLKLIITTIVPMEKRFMINM